MSDPIEKIEEGLLLVLLIGLAIVVVLGVAVVKDISVGSLDISGTVRKWIDSLLQNAIFGPDNSAQKPRSDVPSDDPPNDSLDADKPTAAAIYQSNGGFLGTVAAAEGWGSNQPF